MLQYVEDLYCRSYGPLSDRLPSRACDRTVILTPLPSFSTAADSTNWARICKPVKEPGNWFPIPSLKESIPGYLNLCKFGLQARAFKCLWGPGIDSKEWIPPPYVAWRAGTITLFFLGSYSPYRLFKNSSFED